MLDNTFENWEEPCLNMAFRLLGNRFRHSFAHCIAPQPEGERDHSSFLPYVAVGKWPSGEILCGGRDITLVTFLSGSSCHSLATGCDRSRVRKEAAFLSDYDSVAQDGERLRS